MRKTQNRTGLALGAVIALVAGLFITTPAAQAANESAPVTTATVGTGQSVLITDAFELYTRLGSGQSGSGTWSYEIVASTTSADVVIGIGTTTSSYVNTLINTVSGLIGWQETAAGENYLKVNLANKTSISSQVTVTVTPYQDSNNDEVKSNGDVIGDSYVITFVPWSAMATSIVLQDAIAHDSGITASFTVTQGSINYSQLDSNFTFVLESTNDGAASIAATVTPAQMVTGAYSKSASVDTDPFTTSGTVQSVSAKVQYGGNDLTAETTKAVTARTINNVTISPAYGVNSEVTGDGLGDARVNASFTVNAYPHTNSITTSMAVAGSFSVSAVGSSFDFDAQSGVRINGVEFTSSATLLQRIFTQASGTTTFTVESFGQDTPDSNTTLTFKFTAQGMSKTLIVTFKVPTYSVDYTPTTTAGPAGGAKTFALTVEDNWGVASARTDQRVAASVDLTGSKSATVSGAVVGGAASVTVTPVPSARTGSATLTFTLQTYNQDTQDWDNTAYDSATWNVYSSADGFVSRTVSVSTSVSYGVNLTYSPAVSLTVVNSDSSVVVSAPGLVIRDGGDATNTGSDTITIQATNLVATAEFAGTIAGTYVVTFTSGTATTTSEVIILPAASDLGTTITLDTTVITPGRTKVITGTLTDANGNAVDTTNVGAVNGDLGTASILVTYFGDAGIVVGTMPTETDADGKFRLSVLTSAADRGTLTVTVTYLPQGANTVAAKKVTLVQSINVGATASSADQKVNAGSFKGYVAVYAKGYEGQRMSAKVGNDWVVVPVLASNFVRVVEFTGAGYTIAVRIYIDRVLVDTITVTTK